MITEQINETIEIAKSIGIPLPEYTDKIILVLFLLWIVTQLIHTVGTFLWKLFGSVKSHFNNAATKAFIEERAEIIELLAYEIINFNKQAEWNDFNYTELKAEVEVDSSFTLDSFNSNPFAWIRYSFGLLKSLLRINSSEKIEESLIKAIIKSKSRRFMVIGDPGSGKTVSLKHLFLKMANEVKSSKSKKTVVPLYLNLKHLDIDCENLNKSNFKDWILSRITSIDNRDVKGFLDRYFDKMLKDGSFFFLFDSFDEIPSVMDSQEDSQTVYQYSQAIEHFLNSYPKCQGLVSSRPYRSPKKFDGQKITILSLPEKRVKKALKRYLKQHPKLADKIWIELVSREDLITIIKNPFYLGLLAQYCKENRKLPDRIYDLFESFIITRAKTDEKRLLSFGFSPEELIRNGETLAYAMTKNAHIGLEANVLEINDMTSNLCNGRGWDSNKIDSLIDALSYSKLGKISRENSGNPKVFSFVHRRFHEYFCARYLKEEFQSAPFEQLNADNRWREVLVLLCEVLPLDKLKEVFGVSLISIKAGINSNQNTEEHKKALEAVLFLKDGFKSRLRDLPLALRIECSNYIRNQFETTNLLNQKRALEALIVVNDDLVSDIIKSAFSQKSRWLAETAIKSCRILKSIPNEIEIEIKTYLYNEYSEFKTYQCYVNYDVFFSSSTSLKPLQSFLQRLTIITFEQILFISLILIYLISYNLQLFIAFTFSIILFLSFRLILVLLKDNSVIQKRPIFFLKNDFLNSSMKHVFKEGPSSTLLIYNPFILFSFSWIVSITLLNTSLISNLILTNLFGIQLSNARFEFNYYMLILSIVPLMINMPLADIATSSNKMRNIHPFFFLLPILTFIAPFFESDISRLIAFLNQGTFSKISGILTTSIAIFVLIILISVVFLVIKVTFLDVIKEFILAWKNHKLTAIIIQKLSVSMWCWWSIIAFSTCYNVLISFDYGMILNFGISYVLNDLLSSGLFLKYGSILPWIFLLTNFLNMLLLLVIIIFYSVTFILVVLKGFSNLVSDQIALHRLVNQLENNQISTEKALKLLRSLKTEITKAQYVRLLLKYLPVEKDTTILINEAIKNKGDVRDLLFQLAESWEDSTDNNVY